MRNGLTIATFWFLVAAYRSAPVDRREIPPFSCLFLSPFFLQILSVCFCFFFVFFPVKVAVGGLRKVTVYHVVEEYTPSALKRKKGASAVNVFLPSFICLFSFALHEPNQNAPLHLNANARAQLDFQSQNTNSLFFVVEWTSVNRT